MEDDLFLTDDYCVARIRAPLKPHNNICIAAQEIYNLPFALISPLNSNHTDIRHYAFLSVFMY
jgi:hypothetical protein